MRANRALALIVLGASWSSIASAADALKFGPVPDWVSTLSIPETTNAQPDAPIAMLLNDEQVMLEPGKVTSFTQFAMKIQTAQGLAAGNISIPWNPAVDTITVHKLQILRGKEVIDVLAGGQSFTTLRRESNLDKAALDGRLTANIQPEGLQEGDIIVLAASLEQSDPILKSHVQALISNWNLTSIQLARSKLIWPASMDLRTRISGDLPKPVFKNSGSSRSIELRADGLQPSVLPVGAPARFQLARLAEASDFKSWAQVAELMRPLYVSASQIPESGPLRNEVDRIRTLSTDPAKRTELALRLVQDRIRYVALLMGSGGYVPATAQETWSRRFGDCKAKSALLLGILRELEIEAEPVLVSSTLGDGLNERLPMLALFNHVLVRARIGGKPYWLDGTRESDGALAALTVPNFGWGLPLVQNAALVPMTPPPLTVPAMEKQISIDASDGVFAPVPVSIERTFRGDRAILLNSTIASLSPTQADEFYRAVAKEDFEAFTVKASNSNFDRERAEFRISLTGEATLNWKDNWYSVPASVLAFKPDFERAAGPQQHAPFALTYPNFEMNRITMRLPISFATGQKLPEPINETVAGIEYRRSIMLKDQLLAVETSERSIKPEVSYQEARAAEGRLRALDEEDVFLKLPRNYALTESDAKVRQTEKLNSANDLIERGNQYLNARMLQEALKDFSEATRLDPKSIWALANRGLTYVWMGQAENAKKDLAAADQIEAGNPVVARARGLLAMTNRNFAEAIEQFSKSLEREPKNGFALLNRASAYRQLNNVSAALVDTQAVIDNGGGTTDARLLRANIFNSLGKLEDAEKEAESLILEQPKSDNALVAAAKILARVGKQDRAMAVFDQAIAVANKPYIYVNRAESRPLADTEAKLADLEAALKINPDDFNALALKAEILNRVGRPKEAAASYTRLSQIRPDHIGIKTRLAAQLWKAQEQSESSRLFEEARKQATTAPEFNDLCWDKAINGILLESALQDCRDAIEKDPGNPAYLDSLGMVLLKLGRFNEAIEAFGKAIGDRPFSSALMGRAFAYAAAGDKVRADADRSAAIKMEPEVEARYLLYGLKY